MNALELQFIEYEVYYGRNSFWFKEFEGFWKKKIQEYWNTSWPDLLAESGFFIEEVQTGNIDTGRVWELVWKLFSYTAN